MARFASVDEVDDIAPARARTVLREAGKQLLERGLLDAAQWCVLRDGRC